MARNTMLPAMAMSQVRASKNEPSPSHPSASATRPPAIAPTTPISSVTMMPTESSPGRTARAMSPATRPSTIQAMIPIELLLGLKERCANVARSTLRRVFGAATRRLVRLIREADRNAEAAREARGGREPAVRDPGPHGPGQSRSQRRHLVGAEGHARRGAKAQLAPARRGGELDVGPAV